MFTDSLTNTSLDGVSALHKPLREGVGKKKSFTSNESSAGGITWPLTGFWLQH